MRAKGSGVFRASFPEGSKCLRVSPGGHGEDRGAPEALRKGWEGRWHSAPCRAPRMSCCAPVGSSPPDGIRRMRRDKASLPYVLKAHLTVSSILKKIFKNTFFFPQSNAQGLFLSPRPPLGKLLR